MLSEMGDLNSRSYAIDPL